MPSSNVIIECTYCSQSISTNSYQCTHCLTPLCYHCLIKHHHHYVKNEFLQMIERIDEILARFLHHAHNQTEWTNHLTDDRKRLKIYIELIENSYTQLPILILPSFQWVNHVRNLIDKYSFAIDENCCPLMYPYLNSFIKSSNENINKDK